MTLSSKPQSPAAAADTPTLDTARTAAVRAAVRAQIEPRTGFWQFELQPWHYWTAITSTLITGVGFAVLYAIAVHR